MRIVVSTLGTHGDVIPLARLAAALAARGHDVTAHAWPLYAALLAAPGVTFAPSAAVVTTADLDDTARRAVLAPTPGAQVRCFVERFYLDQLDAYHRTVRQAIAGAQLAIINVIDHVAQATADALGVPWIGWHSRPLTSDARQAAEDQLFGGLDAEVSARISRVVGARTAIRVFRQASRFLDLVAASPQLVGASAPPGRAHVTGHWLAPASVEAEADIAGFVAADPRPTIFVTFGTIPDAGGRAQIVREACARAGVRAVVQGAAIADADTLVIARRIPYGAVLGAVAGVLHHGGAGTTHEACRAGTPSLCIPHFGDQYYWARILAEREFGPAFVPHVQLSSALLAPRIRALVTEPRYRARAGEIAATLAQETGLARAIELVEASQNELA